MGINWLLKPCFLQICRSTHDPKTPISFQKTLLQVGKNRNMFHPLNTHGCHEKLSFTSPHRLRPSHKGAESTLKAVQVRHILSQNAKCNNRLLGIWYFHDTMIQWFNCQKTSSSPWFFSAKTKLFLVHVTYLFKTEASALWGVSTRASSMTWKISCMT